MRILPMQKRQLSYLWIALLSVAIASSALLYFRQHQIFLVAGEVLTMPSEEVEPVRGAQVLIFKTHIQDNREFKSDLGIQEMHHQTPDGVDRMTYQGCKSFLRILEEHYSGTVEWNQQDIERMRKLTPEKVQEEYATHESQMAPYLETATANDGKFKMQLPRGNYVILVEQMTTSYPHQNVQGWAQYLRLDSSKDIRLMDSECFGYYDSQ